MSRDRFLTPDNAPTSWTCRAFSIPDDEQYLALFKGALLETIAAYNWEQVSGITPEDAAAAFWQIYDSYRECRMIGEITCYAGSTPPDARWLLCDGVSLLRADYPDLYAIIGTTYGAVDGSHFSLPDLRGRVALSAGTGSGLSSYSLGATGGEETHTLTTAESPVHSHSDTGHTHSEGIAVPAVGAAIVGVPIPSAVPAVGVTGIGFAGISNTGGGGAHNNIQPYLALNYLILALP